MLRIDNIQLDGGSTLYSTATVRRSIAVHATFNAAFIQRETTTFVGSYQFRTPLTRGSHGATVVRCPAALRNRHTCSPASRAVLRVALTPACRIDPHADPETSNHMWRAGPSHVRQAMFDKRALTAVLSPDSTQVRAKPSLRGLCPRGFKR